MLSLQALDKKPLASKKIEKWIGLDPRDFCNEVMLRNYKRNENLVNLSCIPKAIVNQINEKYDNYKLPQKWTTKLLYKE